LSFVIIKTLSNDLIL